MITKKIIVFLLLSLGSIPQIFGLFGQAPQRKLVVINPAGDAKNTGRKLTNNYERAITFKIAEALAKALESRYDMRIILTRSPGDELVHLQNASAANRTPTNFFININVYREESEKPKIYLFHRMLDPLADLTKRTYPLNEFTRVSHAHTRNIHQTKSFGERIKMVLTQPDYQKLFDFSGIHGIPIRPLEGIKASAVLFDIGLNDEEKWPMLIEPLAASLKFLLEY